MPRGSSIHDRGRGGTKRSGKDDVIVDATVRRCDADREQANKRSGICALMLHDVSLSAGDLGS